jgi:hypothetical protein
MKSLHTVSLFPPKSKPAFIFPSRNFSPSYVATVWSRVILFTYSSKMFNTSRWVHLSDFDCQHICTVLEERFVSVLMYFTAVRTDIVVLCQEDGGTFLLRNFAFQYLFDRKVFP